MSARWSRQSKRRRCGLELGCGVRMAEMVEMVEMVWEYPGPPRLKRTALRLRVVHRGVAETERGWRVLETSHPPVYYSLPTDVGTELLEASARGTSMCGV